MLEWLRTRLTNYTPEVGRIFVCCDDCKRVVPHYRITGRHGRLTCRCGGRLFRAKTISEWRAAWWTLVVGLFWRRLICRQVEWDPRVPMRIVTGKYA
jgi:hypothetical protein